MDIKAIKELAEKYSQPELMRYADELEQLGKSSVSIKEDLNEVMSDLLQAAEVRNLMDEKKLSLQEAVREFSKRVRAVVS